MAVAPSLKAWSGALLAAVASACVAPAALAAGGAEYALRWAPADGGPGSIEEVATLLRLPAGKHEKFEVRYFSTAQASDLPPGASVIVRERSSGSKTESMYKLRSAAPLQGNEVGTALRCAFPAATKRKSEVDVGWTAEGALKKNYSYSCTADGLVRTVAPPGFEARPTGCSSKVLRMEAKDVKIERWSLPGGALALEVSWNGEDTPKDLDRFTTRVAQPLLARGVKPLQESKTELGSRC
ncbi:hypothetical protein [Variovorax sp. J22R115]|uniref:hypothetical protein n=1 Tax=Variovorax sp. J22R115 TaxID=3053509 RepID=UPI002576A045|nr:hypothetical protein [Variovorax sp. J22R115]MDM0053187.1 hypothetical protein [Variovorax sp. J22R115]